MSGYLMLLLGTALVNNVVLVKFLGLCPFMGVSKKIDSALCMGMATTFVLTLASVAGWVLEHWVLQPLDDGFLHILSFILVIAAAVQFTEMVVRKVSPPMATGAGRQLAAQHSHSFEGWYAHIPGIKIVAPATIDDAHGMLGAALADGNPVLVFEYPALFEMAGELSSAAIDIAHAVVRRQGTRVTLVAYGGCVPKALAAAETLATEGINAEVVDLRVLRPLDMDTVLASVRKTRRAVIVDEGWRSGSLSAEVMARIMESAFYDLDAPVARVCREEVPIPYP